MVATLPICILISCSVLLSVCAFWKEKLYTCIAGFKNHIKKIDKNELLSFYTHKMNLELIFLLESLVYYESATTCYAYG